jgi:hypothetical protein
VPDVLFVVAPVLLFAAYTIFILLNEITKAAKTASPLSDFIKTISFLEALPPNLRLRPWGFAPPPYSLFKKSEAKTFMSRKTTFFGGIGLHIHTNPTPPYSILKLH